VARLTASLVNVLALTSDLFELPPHFSPWEEQMVSKYNAPIKLIRQVLVGTLAARKIPSSRQRSILHRYYHGFFDSVSTHFVIGEVIVPVLVCLSPEQEGLPFRVSLCVQSEWLWEGAHSQSHKDFTLAVAQGLSLAGPDVLMREKVNGSCFVAKMYQGKKFLCGPSVCIPVPTDFPVEMAEFDSGIMHVIRPFGLCPLNLEGMRFFPHEWSAITVKRVAQCDEGIMLLWRGTEYRCKRNPSCEIDASLEPGSYKGIWEVCYGQSGEFHYLRPRPGKSYLAADRAKQILSMSARVSDLRVPEFSPVSVRTVTDGPCNGTFGVTGDEIWFDSGWRRSGDSVVPAQRGGNRPEFLDQVYSVGDVYHHVKGKDHMASPLPLRVMGQVVTGSKVCIFSPDGAIYLFQDKGKSIDFVGGSTLPEEDSYQCVVREVWEELGVEIRDVRFLAMSSESSNGLHFHSYVYLAPLSSVLASVSHKLLRVEHYNFSKLDCVPWLSRLVNTVKQIVPDPLDLLSCYDSLSPHVPSVRKVLFSRLPSQDVPKVVYRPIPVDRGPVPVEFGPYIIPYRRKH